MRRALLIAACLLAAAPPAGAADVQRGKSLYGRYCLSCHGMNGDGIAKPGRKAGFGPGRAQTEQTVVAPALTNVGALAADFYLQTGYMPLHQLGKQPRRSRKILSSTEISDLTAYVASLGHGPAIPTPHPQQGNLSQGMHLFTDNCAGCHQVAAEGGYVTGAVPPALENDTSREIAEAVRIGPYVMPTFTKKALSDHDLDSIIAYVQYAKHPDDRGGWALGHLGPVPEGLVTWFIAAVALLVVCLAIGKRVGHES